MSAMLVMMTWLWLIVQLYGEGVVLEIPSQDALMQYFVKFIVT